MVQEDKIGELVKRMVNGYDYIIYPAFMGNIPIELEKMSKYDIVGNQIGYYSLNELTLILEDLFVPVVWLIDDTRVDANGNMLEFNLIHWSFDKGKNSEGITDEQAIINLLVSKGLKDMRENTTLASDIDFTNLTGMEFGIFGSVEILGVPEYVM